MVCLVGFRAGDGGRYNNLVLDNLNGNNSRACLRILRGENEYTMKEERDFDKLPSRIRHYLLEWKDANMEKYCSLYGEEKLTQFTHKELLSLFVFATFDDRLSLLTKG